MSTRARPDVPRSRGQDTRRSQSSSASASMAGISWMTLSAGILSSSRSSSPMFISTFAPSNITRRSAGATHEAWRSRNTHSVTTSQLAIHLRVLTTPYVRHGRILNPTYYAANVHPCPMASNLFQPNIRALRIQLHSRKKTRRWNDRTWGRQ